LLSIDVEEELAKVTLGRLRNRSQVPVALARMAASAGAARLRIAVGHRRLRLEHDGDVPDTQVLEALHTLLDRGVENMLRHVALEKLESLGMLDLLVAFALGADRVDLDMASPVSRRLVVLGNGGRLEFVPSLRKSGVAITVTGGGRAPAAERRELIDALKHARFHVVVDNRRVDRGPHLADMLFQVSVDRGSFGGVIGLPRRGLAGITRILVRGVLERELWESPSDGTVWEAVVDGPTALAPRDAEILGVGSTALLREAIKELYQRAREGYADRGSADRQRIKQLLFRLADHGTGGKAVGAARLFSTVDGERVGVEALRHAALGRVICAIGEKSRRDRYDLSRTVFVLDERDRGFVERHLRLVVREPPRRPEAGRWRHVLSRLLEKIKKRARGAARLLIRTHEVPDAELTAGERRFIAALNRVLQAGLVRDGDVTGVVFIRGRFVGWKRTRQEETETKLMLSIKHSQVKAMVAAFEKDPKSLYAACMLLADGEQAFGGRTEEVLQIILQSAGLSESE
jgi:hypothetical protein